MTDDDGDVDPSATARIILRNFRRGNKGACEIAAHTMELQGRVDLAGSRAPHSTSGRREVDDGQDAVLISTSRPANFSPRTLLTGCSRGRA